MASASISFVLNRLSELALKEAALLSGVGDEIRLLRDKLEWLQTFIQEADQERRKGAKKYAFVGLWVRQTRDVAYEVEDVLDEFLRKVDLARLGLPAWKKWLNYLSSCTTQISVRHEIKGRMDVINDRLKEISDNVKNYQIEEVRTNNASTSAPNSSISAWYADEDGEVLGFVKESKDLEAKLCDKDKTRRVISIVGESGIGKSTLAWKVYESPTIRKEFDVRAWINVPPHIRDNDMVCFIYNRLCPDAHEGNYSDTDVHAALSKYLKDKRYLVMVDGIANFTNFNSLPDNGNGSRVMIITRLEEREADYADSKVVPVKLSKLLEDDSGKLFRRKVLGSKEQFREKIFGSQASSSTDLIAQACSDMHKITQGLPLAIVVLAGLLRTKSIQEWEKVFEQLRSSEESKRVKKILALSFDDLPSRLKSCFLYFAGMPENLILNARRLVRLWAAEGFLKPKKGKTMEDIGQSNLKELISRGMIELVKKDLNGSVWLVAIHDHLHAFAQEEAQEETFLEVHDNADLLAPTSVRRLYLQNFRQTYIPMDTAFPKMRSILCDFAEERSHNFEPAQPLRILDNSLKKKAISNDLRYHALRFLPASKFLRVIDLRGLRIGKVPHAIGDMIHLRYLGLKSHSLAELPSSIARLINLQTLNIKRTEVRKVVQAFWEIPTLRHVVTKKLSLPKSVGLLNNMQTLIGLVCSDPWGKDVSPLHNMVYLRHMEITGLTDQHWAGLAEAFKKLDSLTYMSLAGDKIPFDLFTNFTLRRLQILELYGLIDTSKVLGIEERYALPNLTRLVLKLSMVDQMFMDKIGELPSLMELVLSDKSYRGDTLLFSDSGFNNVTSLVMANLTELSKWTIKPKSIPEIRRIVLSGCSKLSVKLERNNEGEKGLVGLMQNLEEVVACNMPENFSVDPSFGEKINHVTIKTKGEDITDAMQRTGKWRAGMEARYMFH